MANEASILARTPFAIKVVLVALILALAGMTAYVYYLKASSGCTQEGTRCYLWWYDSAGNRQTRDIPCPCR